MKTRAVNDFCFQMEMLVFYPSLFINQLISEAFAGGLEGSGLRFRQISSKSLSKSPVISWPVYEELLPLN